MVQINDIQVPVNIPINQALTQIYGIGTNRANTFCNWFGLAPNLKFKDINSQKKQRIASEFEEFLVRFNILVGEELQIQNNKELQRLRLISSYRGKRNAQGLPVRGQKTKSNAKTQRKRRKT